MKKRAITHNIFGSFSNFIFLFLTSIVLLPYYFKYISTSDYGLWLGGISFLSIFSVLEANIGLILTQKLGEKWNNKEEKEFAGYYVAALFVGLIISAIIIITTFLLKDYLVYWISKQKKINHLFSLSLLLYSISISFTILSSYINSVSQVFLKTFWPPVFNFVSSIFGIVITVWTVPRFGIVALAIGNALKVIVYTILISIFIYRLLNEKKIKLTFELIYVKTFLKNIGLPFISKVGMTLASNFQNFIIATTISATATTVFDITRKLPMVTQMVINMIAVSTFTSFSLLYSEKKTNDIKSNYTEYYFSIIRIVLMLSLFIILLLGKEFVRYWVGIDKYGGDQLLGLLCILTFGDLLRSILSQQYYAFGSFKLTSVSEILFACTFILSAFIFIPLYKLNGIVLAGIIANFGYFIFCFKVEKQYKISVVNQIINFKVAKDFAVFFVIVVIIKIIFNLIKFDLFLQLIISLLAFGFVFIYLKYNYYSLFNFIKSQNLKFFKSK